MLLPDFSTTSSASFLRGWGCLVSRPGGPACCDRVPDHCLPPLALSLEQLPELWAYAVFGYERLRLRISLRSRRRARPMTGVLLQRAALVVGGAVHRGALVAAASAWSRPATIAHRRRRGALEVGDALLRRAMPPGCAAVHQRWCFAAADALLNAGASPRGVGRA